MTVIDEGSGGTDDAPQVQSAEGEADVAPAAELVVRTRVSFDW